MSNSKSIPFLDLIEPHKKLEEKFVSVFREALRTGKFIGGPVVEEFEKEFADYCGTAYCIGVGSGTDALRFALLAAGINKGDAVVTVANTFIATTEAITQCGATPVFVDIDERTYNLSPEILKEYFETKCETDHQTGRLVDLRTGKLVAAIIPVHLYGQMADMDSIMDLAEKYNLLVIEDACQAHGASYFSRRENEWKKAGSVGIASAFSFYPGKNLGAFGEGGAVTTNNEEIAKKIRMIRDHGQVTKYYHEIEGYNGRLDAIQAGILSVKLKHLDNWNSRRRANALFYNERLSAGGNVVTPYEPSWSKAVYHLYVVRVQDRDNLQKQLSGIDLSTGLHYPIPLHLQKAYAHFGYTHGDLPVTEKVTKEIISLPMFPDLTSEQQERISDAIANFIAERQTCSNNS
ncbi:MAG: DegT/DnrJ/EryC1/StrS family aminotransferase [Deltaproteobacteria bacterium]|nr:DegT/DnrJ/EryC1/StrS family aminotransferase [Deltaproteobacteria bacterium]